MVPKWMQAALEEWGVHEIPGPKSNERIDQYLKTVKMAADDDIAWCSAFVNWVIEQSGLTGTGNAMARSWKSWGQKLDTPRLGAVTVFWRQSPTSGLGHVALFAEDFGSNVLVLGGNQSDRVCFKLYPKSQLLGYRWPSQE